MIVGNYMAILSNVNQTFCINSTCLQLFQLFEELIWIKNTTVSNNAFDSKKDTCWNMMSHKLLTFMVDCMTCIAATVEAKDVCVPSCFAKMVSDLSLALITVLKTNNYISDHSSSPCAASYDCDALLPVAGPL